MITAAEIRETKAFKALTPMLKKLTVSRNNIVNSISHGVILIENIGYVKWNNQTKVRNYNRAIIEELIDKRNA